MMRVQNFRGDELQLVLDGGTVRDLITGARCATWIFTVEGIRRKSRANWKRRAKILLEDEKLRHIEGAVRRRRRGKHFGGADDHYVRPNAPEIRWSTIMEDCGGAIFR